MKLDVLSELVGGCLFLFNKVVPFFFFFKYFCTLCTHNVKWNASNSCSWGTEWNGSPIWGDIVLSTSSGEHRSSVFFMSSFFFFNSLKARTVPPTENTFKASGQVHFFLQEENGVPSSFKRRRKWMMNRILVSTTSLTDKIATLFCSENERLIHYFFLSAADATGAINPRIV